jgi:hypothetical protein
LHLLINSCIQLPKPQNQNPKTPKPQKKIRTQQTIQVLYAELEGMAIVGFNESYESYIETAIDALSSEELIGFKEKESRIKQLKESLKEFQNFKKAIHR